MSAPAQTNSVPVASSEPPSGPGSRSELDRSRSLVRAQRRRDLTGLLWVSPWIFGFVVFMLGPMLASLYYSFTEYPLLEAPVWIGLENYRRMLTDEVFHLVLRKTAIYAVIFIPLATALSLLIASMLNEKVKAGGFFQAAVFIPTLVPMAGSAMIWLWLLNGEYGLLNQVLGTVGLPQPNWLTDANWAMPSIVMISLWSIGQMIVVYLAALKEVPDELLEAAALDGMGPLRRFFNVTLPMISPVVLFNVITLMIGSLQVFGIPYVLSAAGQGSDPRAMYFYTMYMYDNAFTFGQMGYASAQAWIQLLITLGLTAMMFLASNKLVHYRA